MLIVFPNKERVVNLDRIDQILISPCDKNDACLQFVFDEDYYISIYFDNVDKTMAQLDKIVRAYHEGQKDIYIEGTES